MTSCTPWPRYDHAIVGGIEQKTSGWSGNLVGRGANSNVVGIICPPPWLGKGYIMIRVWSTYFWRAKKPPPHPRSRFPRPCRSMRKYWLTLDHCRLRIQIPKRHLKNIFVVAIIQLFSNIRIQCSSRLYDFAIFHTSTISQNYRIPFNLMYLNG